jgi:hypothetical protein
VRYTVYGGNKKKVPNPANNLKGKDIGPDRIQADGTSQKPLMIFTKGLILMVAWSYVPASPALRTDAIRSGRVFKANNVGQVSPRMSCIVL